MNNVCVKQYVVRSEKENDIKSLWVSLLIYKPN